MRVLPATSGSGYGGFARGLARAAPVLFLHDLRRSEEDQGEIGGRSGDEGARVTGGSGGGGAGWGRAGAMVGYGGEGCGQEGFGGGLTALMTEASTQTQRIATTVMIVSKLSVRAASTAGHSIRMSKQFVAWRRDAGQSEEGWRWGGAEGRRKGGGI